MAHSIAPPTLGLTMPADVEPLKVLKCVCLAYLTIDEIAAKEIDVVEWKGDILAVGVIDKDSAKDENSKFQNPILKKLDEKLGGLLAEASSEDDFTGKTGQSTVARLD